MSELYDLANDPWEQSDLLALPATGAVRDVYRRLFGELAQLRGYPAALPYGNGCSGAGAVPVLAAIDAPVYGATFHMRVTGLAGASAATFGVLGLGDESWLGLPLPADLGAFGMPGCSALVEPLSVRLLAQSPLSANWPEPLPNDVGLVGLGFFAQALALVPGANAAGALTSAALQVVIGMP